MTKRLSLTELTIGVAAGSILTLGGLAFMAYGLYQIASRPVFFLILGFFLFMWGQIILGKKEVSDDAD